jgi:hypothetical protein
MAQMNRRIGDVETVFLSTSPEHSYLSSSLVKEVARFGGRIDGTVPAEVAAALRRSSALTTTPTARPPAWPPVAGRARPDRWSAAARRLHRSVRRGPWPHEVPPTRGWSRMSDHGGVPPDVEAKLHQLERLVAEAKAVPLSASVMVNRAEIDGLVDDLREALPDELTQARWVVKERDEILERARRRRRAAPRGGPRGARPARVRPGGRPPRRRPSGADRRGGARARPPDPARGRGLRRRQARQLRGGADQDPVGGREGPHKLRGRVDTDSLAEDDLARTTCPRADPARGPCGTVAPLGAPGRSCTAAGASPTGRDAIVRCPSPRPSRRCLVPARSPARPAEPTTPREVIQPCASRHRTGRPPG